MKWMLILVLIFCVPLFINCTRKKRIVNGEETPLGKFMFLPQIKFKYYTRLSLFLSDEWRTRGSCSSTIISKRHILTAAHCVEHLKDPSDGGSILEKAFSLFYGPLMITSKNIEMTKFEMPKIHIHQEYTGNAELPGFDIAIIEFPKCVDFNITPVLLAKDYVDNYSDTAIAAGHGRYIFNVETQKVSDESPPTLRHVHVSIRPLIAFFGIRLYLYLYKEKDVEKHPEELEKKIICAGNRGELPQRADEGDSGGPLLYEWNEKIFQLGVFSFFNGENVRAPGCYTRVSYHCEWIEKITNNEAKCQEMYGNLTITEPNSTNESIPCESELNIFAVINHVMNRNFGVLWFIRFIELFIVFMT